MSVASRVAATNNAGPVTHHDIWTLIGWSGLAAGIIFGTMAIVAYETANTAPKGSVVADAYNTQQASGLV